MSDKNKIKNGYFTRKSYFRSSFFPPVNAKKKCLEIDPGNRNFNVNIVFNAYQTRRGVRATRTSESLVVLSVSGSLCACPFNV